MMKAWINPYRAITSVRNGLGLSVDEQTQIPPRRPLDETSASDPALGKVLQIMKGFLAVIDAIFGILFDFADGPIPDTCKLEQPGVKLAFLRYIETKLELSLDHLTPAFDVRCIA